MSHKSFNIGYSRVIYISTLWLGFSLYSQAQQFPIYSQYTMNGFLLNPAVAGHEGYTAFNLTVREQWLGIKDAPSTYAISAQSRIIKKSFISRFKSVRHRRKTMSREGKVGLGGYIFSDQSGAFTRMGFQAAYAYHITLQRSLLSFGLSVNGFQYKLDKSKVLLEDLNDNLYNNTSDKAFISDANFGVYYSDKNIYAGISAQNIFQSSLNFTNMFDKKAREGAGFALERNYLLMTGYRYNLIDYLFIEPSFFFKFTEKIVGQLDLNLKLYYKEDYWGGISYRTGSASQIAKETLNGRGSSLIFMIGARAKKYYIGYAFDYSFSSLSKQSYGSHEITMAIKFGDNARRYRWLNRY